MLIAKHKLRMLSAIGIICAAVVMWSLNDNRKSDIKTTGTSKQDDIDFFVTDAKINTFSATGDLEQQAVSKKIEHFKQRRSSSIENPFITQFKNQQVTATITSKHATVNDVTELVDFKEQVIAITFRNDIKNIQLKSPLLQFDRKKSTLSTEQDVEFTDTFGNITTAHGMHSDIGLKTIYLKSNVKGTYNEK
jgi:LPS export ABC transporter protein LptC